MHIYAIGLALGTSIVGLPATVYNNAGLWCWIRPYPQGCLDSLRNDGITTCIRGDNAWTYRLFMWYVPLWFTILFATAIMTVVYCTVRQQANRTVRFSSMQSPLEHSKMVRNQAMWYLGAFYVAYIFPTIGGLVEDFGGGTTYFVLNLLAVIFLPMQGFMNFIVYMRPRYHTFRKKNPDYSILQTAKDTLRSSLGCPRQENDDDEEEEHDDDYMNDNVD
jgi:hypothetical protein